VKRPLHILLALVLLAPGCSSRAFVRIGRDPGGNEYGIAREAVQKYARDRGISWDEALEQIREEQQALRGEDQAGVRGGEQAAAWDGDIAAEGPGGATGRPIP
jgi:hypothetical protein